MGIAMGGMGEGVEGWEWHRGSVGKGLLGALRALCLGPHSGISVRDGLLGALTLQSTQPSWPRGAFWFMPRVALGWAAEQPPEPFARGPVASAFGSQQPWGMHCLGALE